MNRSHARINHPSLHPSLNGRAVSGSDRAPVLLYRDVVQAYEELEHALDNHEPLAATEAALVWWDSLKRLRAVS